MCICWWDQTCCLCIPKCLYIMIAKPLCKSLLYDGYCDRWTYVLWCCHLLDYNNTQMLLLPFSSNKRVMFCSTFYRHVLLYITQHHMVSASRYESTAWSSNHHQPRYRLILATLLKYGVAGSSNFEFTSKQRN